MSTVWLVEAKHPEEPKDDWSPLYEIHYSRACARKAAKDHAVEHGYAGFLYRVRKYARIEKKS